MDVLGMSKQTKCQHCGHGEPLPYLTAMNLLLWIAVFVTWQLKMWG